MMDNFYEFIKKDIDAKKTLIGTLPTKTKTNKRKFNQTLEDIKETYEFLKDNRINNKISDDLKNIIALMIEYFKHQDKKIRGYIM